MISYEGETGADAKCQERADSAGLRGNFKAWLLDGKGDQYIYEKFGDYSYVNMLGDKLITTFYDYNGQPMGFRNLEGDINYDEYLRKIKSSDYRGTWTNLNEEGGIYNMNDFQTPYNFHGGADPSSVSVTPLAYRTPYLNGELNRGVIDSCNFFTENTYMLQVAHTSGTILGGGTFSAVGGDVGTDERYYIGRQTYCNEKRRLICVEY